MRCSGPSQGLARPGDCLSGSGTRAPGSPVCLPGARSVSGPEQQVWCGGEMTGHTWVQRRGSRTATCCCGGWGWPGTSAEAWPVGKGFGGAPWAAAGGPAQGALWSASDQALGRQGSRQHG